MGFQDSNKSFPAVGSLVVPSPLTTFVSIVDQRKMFQFKNGAPVMIVLGYQSYVDVPNDYNGHADEKQFLHVIACVENMIVRTYFALSAHHVPKMFNVVADAIDIWETVRHG